MERAEPCIYYCARSNPGSVQLTPELAPGWAEVAAMPAFSPHSANPAAILPLFNKSPHSRSKFLLPPLGGLTCRPSNNVVNKIWGKSPVCSYSINDALVTILPQVDTRRNWWNSLSRRLIKTFGSLVQKISLGSPARCFES